MVLPELLRSRSAVRAAASLVFCADLVAVLAADRVTELAAEAPDDKPKQRYLAVALLLHGEALALEGKTSAALEKFV